MPENATVVDSEIYRDIFSTSAMRAVWSDQARIQRYLDVERALADVQAELGIIPDEAAKEIGEHCQADQLDFQQLKKMTEHIGYPCCRSWSS